ncbi:MAG: hypothetical protein ACRER4_08930 [Steroidobacteraceae bacterium]
MRDCWLNKRFSDLQTPAATAEYRARREEVLARYSLEPEVRRAVLENDVPFLAKRTNPSLLRYFFFATGIADAEFIRTLRPG